MHANPHELKHHHNFQPAKTSAEQRTLVVFGVTTVAMIAEIICGWLTGSMALFADGWHMATHAVALGLAAFVYILSRKHAHDRRYAFGTWKIEILGSYTSAIILGMVSVSMVGVSIERLVHPLRIQYTEALIVAVVGLIVNIISIFVLGHGNSSHKHSHTHADHDHGSNSDQKHAHAVDTHTHEHADIHSDLNLKAAFIHVIADALTSVLAILSLVAAKLFSWVFLDPVIGIVGAILIMNWTKNLFQETASILLDKEMDAPIVQEITRLLESDSNTQIVDLHVWRVAQTKYSCIAVIARKQHFTIEDYKLRLKELHDLVHVTIEMHDIIPIKI